MDHSSWHNFAGVPAPQALMTKSSQGPFQTLSKGGAFPKCDQMGHLSLAAMDSLAGVALGRY